MRKILTVSLLLAVIIWIVYAAILLGYKPGWLPAQFAELAIPASLADFGQAFSALDGLISSLALMLGLCAVLIQVKQSADSNLISALTARQQFLLAEQERFDLKIKEHIKNNTGKDSYDARLVKNMSNKKSDYLEESKQIDEKLQHLISKI
jgi:hypothetical protein